MTPDEPRDDTSCISTLFEAISSKDERMLEACLRETTINTVLRFESIYGFSPLIWCVQTGDESYLGLVRSLLSSGLYDSQMVDSKGRPMLASIVDRHAENPAFVEGLIKLEIDGVDDVTACYRILKQNSLPLFKLYQKDRDETKLFEAMANALIQLKVKNFVLSPELKIFVQWKLADYSYRHLSGDYIPQAQDPPDEWKKHIEVISDFWNKIVIKYDNGNYADIDDCLLQCLTVIHNHLYFLQYKPFVKHLPMQEVIFCLAKFLFIFKVDSVAYRLILNKRLIMQFLRMIVLQLDAIKENLLKIENQLKTILSRHDDSHTNEENDKLFDVLLDKIKGLAIPNKEYFLKRCNEKKEKITRLTDAPHGKIQSVAKEKDTLIKDMLKTIKKHDKEWAELKNNEMKQLEKERMITAIKDGIPHAVHPANVADRLIALLKTDKPLEDAVADIMTTEVFSMEQLMDRQHRRTARKLIKCYNKLKQYYSLEKIYRSFSQVAQSGNEDPYVFGPCIKRALTVLGETMKNTKSTPNMPDGRVRHTVEQLLTSQLSEVNISHRNTYAKAFSLKRLLIADSLEDKILINLPHYMTVVRVMLLLLLMLAGADIRRSFYGMLYRCRSMKAIRSLLVYAGKDDDLVSMQKEGLAEVQTYFRNGTKLLMELKQNCIAQNALFVHVEQEFVQQSGLAEELRTMLKTQDEISFSSMHAICFACDDLATVRRLLRWKLVSHYPNRLLEKMGRLWDTSIPQMHSIVWSDPRLATINTATVPNKLKAIQMAMNTAHYNDCIKQTRNIAKEIGILDGNDQIDALNTMLRPYYDNIFFLDNKWKALKAFCKQNRLSWNDSLEYQARKSDQDILQNIFDDRRSRLRSILETCNIRTAEDISIHMGCVSPCVLSAIEYIQLEMCEMLTTVGYFGDNFHYLKHRIPIIMGKSYRNMLAHDTLSYDILTDSGEEKLVINAFILASTERNLFDTQRRVSQHNFTFPTFADTIKWVEKQQELLDALKKEDPKLLLTTMQNGGEIRSLFCISPVSLHHQPKHLDVTNLTHHYCHSNSIVIQLVDRYYPSFAETYYRPEVMLRNALERQDFYQAVKLYRKMPDALIDTIMFAWPMVLSHLSKNYIEKLSLQDKQACLKQCIDYGNEQCAREMISTYMVEADQHTMSHAIMCGMYSITALLVQKATHVQINDMELVIIMHWNDLLNDFSAKTAFDDKEYITLLETAVRVNNEEALLYLLQDNRRTEKTLTECIVSAALNGRNNILKCLLNNFRAPAFSTLLHALRESVATKHFKTARLLLEEVCSADLGSHNGGHAVIGDILLGLTMLGQVRLIRKIRSICSLNHDKLYQHPLVVAIQHGTATPRMIATLRWLGFGWLDSTSILHEIVQQGMNQPNWNVMWNEIDKPLSLTFTLNSEHCSTAINVLQRWKMIAFVEQIKSSKTSLYCAIQSDDKQTLQTLLSRSLEMRVLKDTGLLRDIVFQIGSEIILLYAEYDQWDVGTCCGEMISRMQNFQRSTTNETGWQEFTVVCGAVKIQFAVYAFDEISPSIHESLKFDDTTTLIDNLQDIQTIANALFSEHTVWHASFINDKRNVYFWRFEDLVCAFDIYSPGSNIDLSLTVNAKALAGRTALHSAVLKGDHRETLQLLIANGANILQKDNAGYTTIHFALQNPTDPDTALYLMEECRLKNLPILEITDGTGKNRLIHTAVMRGHRAAVEYLLKHNADVTVRNVFLQTPAHILAIKPVYGSVSLMKLLLDRDQSVLEMVDVQDCTPLSCAAKVGCIELLDTIMHYNPNFNIPENRAALNHALTGRHVQWAIRFVQHLNERRKINE